MRDLNTVKMSENNAQLDTGCQINKYDDISSFLDFARWLSALLVVTGHLRSLLFVEYSNLKESSIFIKFFYFITGLGHEAVVIFFVLSGFLVGGGVIKKINNFKFCKYLFDRSTRIYIVFIPSLIVGFFYDHLGISLFNTIGLYNGSHEFSLNLMNYIPENRLDIKTFLGNTLMLQKIALSTFGSNSPLWSLAYEFWYYITFPILLFAFKAGTHHIKSIAIVFLLLVSAIFFLPTSMTVGFLIWLLGASLAINTKSIFPISVTIIFFFLAITISRFKLINIPFITDFFIGVFFSLILKNIQTKNRFLSGRKFSCINKKLAAFTFSLYVTHFPLMLLITSASASLFNVQIMQNPSPDRFLFFLLVLLILYLHAYIFSKITEHNTDKVRAFLGKRLNCKVLSRTKQA